MRAPLCVYAGTSCAAIFACCVAALRGAYGELLPLLSLLPQCAGLVGGRYYGVARGVTIVSMRVVNCARQSEWGDIAAAIEWALSDTQVCYGHV